MVRAIWISLLLAAWCLTAPAAHAQTPAVKMTVSETGLYVVTETALAGKGLDTAALDPRTFRVTHEGQEIAIRVINAEPLDAFGPGEAIEFYATGIDRADPRYAHTNDDVYWLWLSGAGGTPLRMTESPSAATLPVANFSAYTKRQRMEQDNIYIPALPLPEGADRWMWTDRLGEGSNLDVPFKMTGHAGGPVTLQVALQGATNDLGTSQTDHSIDAFMNGGQLVNWQWDGFVHKVFTRRDIPDYSFNVGDNTLTLRNRVIDGVAVNSVLLDWFEVTYERRLMAEFRYPTDPGLLPFTLTGTGGVADFYLEGFGVRNVELYDVTDPRQVRQIEAVPLASGGTGSYGADRFVDDIGTAERSYFAVGAGLRWQPRLDVDLFANLASPDNAAEYVVISHPSMLASANQLAAHRAGTGMSVKVVSTTDIYDEFAFGVTDPAAIRAFLQTALESWTVPPTYVLLFGDATPTFKTATGVYKLPYGINYVPTHLFTTQEGGVAPDDNWFVTVSGGDPLPDMFIGRLPVVPATAGGVVAKIIAYETQGDTSWTDQVQFAASWVDGTTVFEDHVDGMADMLPPEYTADRLMIGQMGADAVRDSLAANLNDGRLLTVFSGHGGGFQWANEQILVSDDMDVLENNPRLTFLLGFNCATGYFVEPFPQTSNGLSLGEAGVSAAGGGAIGAWMAGWKGYVSDQDVMGSRFIESFLAGGGDGSRTQGSVTTDTYLMAIADGVPAQSVRSFNLLGDPAVPLYDGTQAPAPPPPTGGGGEAAGGGGCAMTGGPAGWGDASVLLLLLLGALLRIGWRRIRA